VALDLALDSFQVHPEVVGVEVLELLDGFEVLFVRLRNLSDLEKAKFAFVLKKWGFFLLKFNNPFY
jgi:hypothetical protein